MLIKDLPLQEIEVKCLQNLVIPKTIAQIAVELERSYSGTNQKLLMWEAQDWIKRAGTISGKVLYALNKKFFYKV